MLPDHLSYSQLSMYNRCSEQYRFRYVDGIKERPALAPTSGKAGHAALETNNKRKIRTGEDMPEVELLDYFSGNYDAAVQDLEPSDLKPSEDIGRTKDNIVHELTVYRRNLAPQLLPILAEHSFDLHLPTPQPIRVINGVIDVIDHWYGIHDFKFTNSRTPKTQLEIDTSIQLTLYDIAFEQATGHNPSSVGIIQFMPPGKDPIRYPADVVKISRTPEYLSRAHRERRKERVVNQFYQAERAIEAGIFMPTDDPRICSWCGYKDRCQFNLDR